MVTVLAPESQKTLLRVLPVSDGEGVEYAMLVFATVLLP